MFFNYLKGSIPSMVWGGLFGRILGMIIHKNYSTSSYNVTPGMYALLGKL